VSATEAVQKMAEAALVASNAKSEFLANMSHEIRTPMNAVLGMTNLIIDNPQSSKVNSYLSAVKKSSENLLVIINDILDLSKLQAGKMDLEHIPFRISEQMSQVYNTMQFKAEEKGLILQTEIAKDVPDVLVGDPSRLNQVLINLCANAIKFTEKGSVKIIVVCAGGLNPALSEGEGASTAIQSKLISLFFRVIDTGIGIPADKIGKLFESFQQVDASTSRKYGGTGLGLSISKTLVELQGGKMEVRSEEGKGSEFSFTLSYAIATEQQINELVKESKVDNTSLTGIKILVAEDNEYNQIVIKDTLANLIKNVKVEIAENGKIVIDKLLAAEYDVILMDAQMPEMSGLEASEYIRKNLEGKKKNIPIIALTASVLNTDLNKCFDAGMNDYVPKPFTRVQLLNTLAKYYKNEYPENALYETLPVSTILSAGSQLQAVTNLSFLRDFCGGDEARMKKYVDIYLKVTPENYDKITIALNQTDYLSLSRLIHGMKAHLNYMGMKKTRDVADKVEKLSNDKGDMDQISILVSQMQKDFEISKDELSAFLLNK
jgi:CheY-like chemotaxis protein/nitrogen-specific signal transduction histidine kinase/HPt (histidine-containing phosphotransfer) domain-containing protein